MIKKVVGEVTPTFFKWSRLGLPTGRELSKSTLLGTTGNSSGKLVALGALTEAMVEGRCG